MILLRQKLYATAASFKPKFRKRFRSGDFTYVQAKDPRNEMLNHQAYKEVACEDEFKNNPETYKIRQGLFSDSDDDEEKHKKSLQKSRKREAAAAGIAASSSVVPLGIYIKRDVVDDPNSVVRNFGVDTYNKLKKRIKEKKSKEIKEEEERLYKKLRESSGAKIKKGKRGRWYYDPEEGRVVQPKESKHAATLSHELGHRHYCTDKNAKKLGKLTHKFRGSKLGKYAPGAGSLIGMAGGAAAGVDKARREEQGKKETVAGKLAPVLGNLPSAPMLHTEAAASKKGIELLKKAGASDKYLKLAKRHLRGAYGTYAGTVVGSIGAGYMAKEAAYRREKENIRISKLDPKDQEKEKDKRKIKNSNKLMMSTLPLFVAGNFTNNAKLKATLDAPYVAAAGYKFGLEKKLYKKYHPENQKPKLKDINDWEINEMGIGWKSKKQRKKFESNDAIRKKLRGD